MKKGLYIVIEGVDGCGKGAQVKALINALVEKGLDCTFSFEPGGTDPGMMVREILVDKKFADFQQPKCQVLGYNYARAMLVENVFKKLLAQGISVLVDRSWISTIAYQCFGEGEDLEKVLSFCEYALSGCMPDHIFILDVSVEEAKRRIQTRGGTLSHYDAKPAGFFEKLREGYVWAADHYSDITTVVNGERDQETIAAELLQSTLELFERKRLEEETNE